MIKYPAVFLFAAIALVTGAARAADSGVSARGVWSGTYQCSAMRSDVAPSPAFTSSVRMVVEGASASITKESGEIKQTLSGEVKPDGSIRLEGVGMRKDTSSPGWRYRFEGRFEGDRFQAKGMMFSANLATKLRDCSMTLTRAQTSATQAQATPAPEPVAKAAPRAAAQDEARGVPKAAVSFDPLVKELDFTERNDSAVVEGTVYRAMPHRYILNAKKGQALAATLRSRDEVRFDLYEPGSSLQMLSGGFVVQGARVGGTPEGTQLGVELPNDGKYLLLVRAPKDQAPYTLELAVNRGASSVGGEDAPWWSREVVWIPAALILAALVLLQFVRKRDRRMFRPN
jgi:hypothetical protein